MKISYTYNAKLIRVTDGDTVHALIDVGFRLFSEQPLRLYGINAPEIKTPEGKLAKAHLTELLGTGDQLTIKSYKDTEKYGRYLAEIYLPDDPISINQKMIDGGFAVEYFGGAR